MKISSLANAHILEYTSKKLLTPCNDEHTIKRIKYDTKL